MKPTDVPQFIEELGAGIVEEKLATIISTVATQVVALDKVGEVTIKLKFKRVGASEQIRVDHEIGYKQPKKRGVITETDEHETIMYVNEGGNVTLFPENQMDMIGMGDKQRVD